MSYYTALDELRVIPSRALADHMEERLEAREYFEAVMFLKSADDECSHGNCRGTARPDCDCWGGR